MQEGCSELTDDVTETCGQDDSSEQCRLARRAAHGCLRGCRDTLRNETRNCVRDGEGCLRSCPDAEPESPESPDVPGEAEPAESLPAEPAPAEPEQEPEEQPAEPAAKKPGKLRFNFRFQPWEDVLDWFARQADLSLVLDARHSQTIGPRSSSAARSAAGASFSSRSSSSCVKTV